MDEFSSGSGDTLRINIGPVQPGSRTCMEPTALPRSRPGGYRSRREAVDLSFLTPSNRAGSLGKIGGFEIVAVKGRGAMGIVLKGYDRTLRRPVAVKVQDPSLAMSYRARARFLKEARAAAAIENPHVVTIHDVNIVQDRPYLVMEYVETSLRERVKDGGPLSTVEVARIAGQVTRGLAAAHARGILHRDIKPANILLDSKKGAKITDFGLAVAGLEGEASASASPHRVAGTPGYMSPEQVRGEELDARSDLFSLGCVIHAMFAGHSPFARETPERIPAAVCEEEPEPTPVPLDCPIGAGLTALVARLLAKDRTDRPGSADEVADCLAALLAETEGEARPTTRIWAAIAASALALAAAIILILAYLPRPSPHGGSDSYRASWDKTAPSAPVVRTVGRGGDFPDLRSALARAKPGMHLRLIDATEYKGPFLLTDAAKYRDLTIESRSGATLTAPRKAGSVIEILNVPGVTIRGVKIVPLMNQLAVLICGAAAGTTLDNLDVHSPPESEWTQVFITKQAMGTASRPIVVKGSRFNVAHGGVTIQGEEGKSVGFVEVRGNRFSGDDEQVHVLQAVHDVTVTGNIFVGGQPLTLNFFEWGGSVVRVTNNTFFDARSWLHPTDSVANQEGVVICNNLILETSNLDIGSLSRMAGGKWVFHHNLYEPTRKARVPNEGLLAETRHGLEVVSRDPTDPGFLRPTPNSVLTTSGAGGAYPKYVGALAPAVKDSLRRKHQPADAK